MREQLRVQPISIFSPAIWLMDRLTYPRKFILIGLLFALPLGLVLFLLISEIDDRIYFSQKEVVGNSVLHPLRFILQDLQSERGLRYSLAHQAEFASQQAMDKTRKKLSGAIEQFSELEKNIQPLFSVEQRWSLFLESWRGRLKDSLSLTEEENFKADTRQINILLKLMTDVADRSNLILDPDLDSYYLMTSVVTQLPVLTEQLGQARGWGSTVVFNQEAAAYDVFYLSNLVGGITQAQGAVKYNYEVIFRENPGLQSRLKLLLDKSFQANEVFLQIIHQKILGVRKIEISPQEYWSAGTAAIAANFQLYDVSASVLNEVLQKRIDRFAAKKNAVLLFTLLMLLLVIYLVAAFYIAMMRVISILGVVSQQIVAGQMEDKGLFPDSHDEMGRVVESFSKLAVRLRSERDQSASLIFSTPIIVCGIAPEGLTHFVNPAGENLTGYRSDELVGHNWWSIFYPGHEYQQVEKLFEDFKKGDVRDYEMTLTTKSGEKKVVSWNSVQRFDKSGQRVEIIGFGNDVTEKKRAELRLNTQHAVTRVLAKSRALDQALKEMIREICQNLNWQEGAIWQVDVKEDLLRCIDFWSGDQNRFEGFEEVTRLTTFKQGAGLPGRIWDSRQPAWIFDIPRDDNFPRIAIAEKAGLHSAFGFPLLYGNEFIGVMEFFSTDIRAVDHDLLEMVKAIGLQIGQFIHRTCLEAQLLQSQKMETVGTLAGGIAHDLNNQLTPISGYIDLLMRNPNLDVQSRTFLEEANLAAKRCSAMVFGLLNFSRPSGQVKTTFKLEQMLKDYQKLLQTMFPSNIVVEMNWKGAAGIIRGNETEIQTVLMNFAVNARDAMAATGGKLSIKVGWADFTEQSVRKGCPAGRYAVISVSDTGCGMTQEVIQRIYEPFFTTKPKGKGTGLGLAMVFKIVNEHQGWVDVSSKPGQGTTFQIHLPASQETQESDKENEEEGELSSSLFGKGETILFADDEESVRGLAKALFERLGYKALFAANSDEICELYQRHQAQIALVIMDMTMPSIPGRMVLQKILALNSKARIIVATGFTAEGSADELIAAGAAGFIPKPYTIRPFAELIHQTLSRD